MARIPRRTNVKMSSLFNPLLGQDRIKKGESEKKGKQGKGKQREERQGKCKAHLALNRHRGETRGVFLFGLSLIFFPLTITKYIQGRWAEKREENRHLPLS